MNAQYVLIETKLYLLKHIGSSNLDIMQVINITFIYFIILNVFIIPFYFCIYR
jgi:hypothetical protein